MDQLYHMLMPHVKTLNRPRVTYESVTSLVYVSHESFMSLLYMKHMNKFFHMWMTRVTYLTRQPII